MPRAHLWCLIAVSHVWYLQHGKFELMSIDAREDMDMHIHFASELRNTVQISSMERARQIKRLIDDESKCMHICIAS
jgi:hypothetical protein